METYKKSHRKVLHHIYHFGEKTVNIDDQKAEIGEKIVNIDDQKKKKSNHTSDFGRSLAQ